MSSSALTPTALLATCHALLNVASSLSVNVEFLADPSAGMSADRLEAAEDARSSLEQLSRLVRELQQAARRAAELESAAPAR
jgi:hypothetical protein